MAKAVLITHGIGKPTREDVETRGKLMQGLYIHTTAGEFTIAAYLYAPEHADKAFDLITRQWQEDQALKTKHAGEWNQLTPWRLQV